MRERTPQLSGEIIDLANYPELIPPQVGMIEATRDARDQGKTQVLIDSATGTGKTYGIAHDIKQFIEEGGYPDAKVLYLCHNNSILDQARLTFEDVHPDSTFGNMREGAYETEAQFTFATFATLQGTNKDSDEPRYKAIDPTEYDYIAVDEAHHGPAETYSAVIKHFDPKFLAGFTATTDREDGKQLEELFGEKVFEYRLEQAIADGVLAHPDYRLYTEQSKGLTSLIKQVGALTLKEIREQIEVIKSTPEAKQEVVRTIIEAQTEVEDPRTVVFCNTIEEAEEYQKLIPGSLALHSKLSPQDQKDHLQLYREGVIPTLITVNQLNEGVDVPETNIVAFARGTESKTVWLQQLGRGLRNYPGKKNVIVLDFAASWERINLVAELKDKVEALHKENLDKKPRSYQPSMPAEQRETAPFTFSFSKDALDAISVVNRMRNNGKAKRAKTEKGSRIKKWDEDERAVMEMLSLDKLPNQRVSGPEWKNFEQRLARGDTTVKDEIVMRRLRDTMSHAKAAFKKLPEGTSLTVEDCFQNAIQEIYIAIDKFNPNKGSLGEALNMAAFRSRRLNTINSNIIRVLDGVIDNLSKAKKIARKNGYEELEDARDAGLIDEEVVRHEERVRDIGEHQRYDDVPAQGQGTADIIRAASDSARKKTLQESLENLAYRERRILQLRWGLAGEKPETNDQVSRRFDLTRTRISQIENQSIKKIQNQDEAQSLRDFAGTDETGDHLGKLPMRPAHRRRQMRSVQQRVNELKRKQRAISREPFMHDYQAKQEFQMNENEIARLESILTGLQPNRARAIRLEAQDANKEEAVRRSQVLFALKQNDIKRLGELGYDITVKKSGLTVFQEVVNQAKAEIDKSKRFPGQSDADYIYAKVNTLALQPGHNKQDSQETVQRRKDRRLLTLQAIRDGNMEWLAQFGYDTNKAQAAVHEAAAEHKQHRLTTPIEDYIYLRINQKARKS